MFGISRRDIVLSAAGAYAAFGLTKPIAFVGAAHAQQNSEQPFGRHKVGDMEITCLIDGMIRVPHREGFIRNATVEQTKAALRASGLSDDSVPVPFTAMAVKIGTALCSSTQGPAAFRSTGRDLACWHKA